jgi:AraC-like DNA-binding protein
MKVASRDVDEAREVGGAIYHPHRVRHTTDERTFGMDIEGCQVGPVLAGSLTYLSPVELTTDELDDSYQVNLALRGSFATTRGSSGTMLTTAKGAVYRPGDTTSINGWGNGDQLVAVKLERRSVELAAGRIYRRDSSRPVDFELDLDLGSPEARDWLTLVTMAMRPEGLGGSPTAAAAIGDAIVAGLLSIAGHPDRDRWTTQVRPGRCVEGAIDFIDLNAHRHLTVAEVASAVGVCTRQLQQQFLETVSQAPSEAIRLARLQRVRAALIASDPATTTVASIASAHEYHHLGRFSVLYKKHFGEPPSHTLRRF